MAYSYDGYGASLSQALANRRKMYGLEQGATQTNGGLSPSVLGVPENYDIVAQSGAPQSLTADAWNNILSPSNYNYPTMRNPKQLQPQTYQTQYSDISDILTGVQSEIGRIRSEGQGAYDTYTAQRQAQRQDFQDLMNQSMSQSMDVSMPEIEGRLQQLGLVESGAYPEAVARRQKEIFAQNILPQLSQFDQATYAQQNAFPMSAQEQERALRAASLNRVYGLQDTSSSQSYQEQLANQLAQQQQLGAILGIIPGAIGLAGSSAGLGAGIAGAAGGLGAGGLAGIGAGGAGALGYQGGLLNNLNNPDYLQNYFLNGKSGLSGAIGGAGGGALGSYLGETLGGQGWSSGIGAAGGAAIGGGGIGGALGAGLGGAFGDPLWGAVGGGLGSYLGDYIPSVVDYFTNVEPIISAQMGQGAGLLSGAELDSLFNYYFPY